MSKCGEKEILRASYRRKGYRRKSGSRVPSTRVKASCVPATGKAIRRGSKTPKAERVLPKPGEEVSLEAFGYSTHQPTSIRHNALEKASNKFGSLPILRRLNLLRNYQAHPAAKKVMSADVEFMSALHAKERSSRKSKGSRRSRKSSRGSRKNSRKGSRKSASKGSRKSSRKSRKGSRRSRK